MGAGWSCALELSETPHKRTLSATEVDDDDKDNDGGGAGGPGRGGRMSRQRERDAVLRLLRGEDLETLPRALGVMAVTLAAGATPSCRLVRPA